MAHLVHFIEFLYKFSPLPTPLEPPLFNFSRFSPFIFHSLCISTVYGELTPFFPSFCLHKYISDIYRATQYHTRLFCITKFSSNFLYLLELFVPLSGTFCTSQWENWFQLMELLRAYSHVWSCFKRKWRQSLLFCTKYRKFVKYKKQQNRRTSMKHIPKSIRL